MHVNVILFSCRGMEEYWDGGLVSSLLKSNDVITGWVES